jgi:hypothetical protein
MALRPLIVDHKEPVLLRGKLQKYFYDSYFYLLALIQPQFQDQKHPEVVAIIGGFIFFK